MVVPCSVKRRLNVSAGTMVRPGHASWRRMSAASMPPITRKTRPVTTYMMPSRLWSTVTTHSCKMARTLERSGAATSCGSRASAGTVVVVAFMVSPQRRQVRCELIELIVGQLHRRHEGSGLERRRVFDPGAKIFRCVAHGARAERRAAHQMRQVGAEHTVAGSPADAMAVDAGERREELAALPR